MQLQHKQSSPLTVFIMAHDVQHSPAQTNWYEYTSVEYHLLEPNECNKDFTSLPRIVMKASNDCSHSIYYSGRQYPVVPDGTNQCTLTLFAGVYVLFLVVVLMTAADG